MKCAKHLFVIVFTLIVVLNCKETESQKEEESPKEVESLMVKKVVTVRCQACNKVVSSDTTIIPLPDQFKNQESPPEYLRESKTILCAECSKVEAIFDIPNLLKMKIGTIKTRLGKPKDEFKPTAAELAIDPNAPSTIEYQKGTTNIQIDYNKNGKVVLIFISDDKTGRTKAQIMQLGNLKPNSTEYRVRIQKWLNPAAAKGTSTIAGIEVKSIK